MIYTFKKKNKNGEIVRINNSLAYVNDIENGKIDTRLPILNVSSKHKNITNFIKINTHKYCN